MQKKISSMLACAFLTVMTNTHAEMSFGVCGYEKQTLDAINCAGPASVRDSTVKGEVHVAGPLKAYTSTFDAMDIAGVAELHNSVIKGKASIAGMLKAIQSTLSTLQVAGGAELDQTTVTENANIAGFLTATASHFEKDLSVFSEKIILKSSEVKGNMTIKSKNDKPILQLICKSQVHGTLTFSKLPGIVKMSEDSKIDGKIINGTTEVIHPRPAACPRDPLGQEH